MNSGRYVIITPAHNEAEFLPETIEGIVSQNVRPLKWIVVDDRSKDGTWQILQKAAQLHDWIIPVRIEGDEHRRVGANVVHVFNRGLEHLEDEVDFLVKMDADVILPEKYFEMIISSFAESQRLGMVSGKTYVREGEDWILERIPDTHVSGACKAYRWSCFSEMGGLLPLLGWDILDGAKARSLGWQTRSLRDLPLYHLRASGSARGMLRARMRTGRAMYTIRAHPLFVLGKSLFRAIEKPYLSGLLIPLGYIGSFFRRPPRLEDKELASFLRSEQLGRLSGRTIRQEELLTRSYKN
jgi:biofilm PGA synthesis N-glycosyltransferase PgaC